ncbi:hypothetical protein CQR79_10645 [Aggregatibacter actinomycetemcomitans]|uniref:Uncharacterized protein n=1 Tax=Aggregatibacter actinomycetemcomitans TaxID=714 RepID=A0A2G1DMK3_AGGAC|nr:hypothetical protein [Aggregatibacter actinomycetemcomitans]PHO19755.1 hypothetical protein CQR80_10690 [Aggregatibacter actinomycetemcomitans]PHO22009.1 hypothetical protein CQR79_10645 [Aggregatibacter actinomycetemcomitans]
MSRIAKENADLRNKSQNHFTTRFRFANISPQSQKTIASRGKLNLHMAHSTPKACFFMRNIRTPQENADFVLLKNEKNPIFLQW